MKRNSTIRDAFDFKDVLLIPRETNVKPEDVSTKTRLTKVIHLEIPLIAAGHDNVTESTMAITMARLGGIGVIHDNMPLGKQVEEVRRVKRAESDIVTNPITVAPEASVAEAFDLMTTYKISGLPVIEQASQKVVGIITNRDIRFFEDYAKSVSELMTKNVITAKGTVEKELAKKILHQHRIEKLVLVDEQDRCIGLLTVKDIERAALYPKATRDTFGRLRVGAMVGIGKEAFERSAAMTDAGLDVLFIDVAHAHTREAIGTVSRIRQQRTNEVQIVVGNVVTADAARSFIDAGADAIKVGIGASDRSASRLLSGIGMPQMTAIFDVVEQCDMMNIPVIVEGGIFESSALAKAIAAGAECVVIDSLFAGTDEAPGEICYQNGQAFKVVNPLAKAQHRPSASTVQKDSYHFDEDALDTSTPYRGGVSYMTTHLLSGLKFAMAYTGSKDIKSMIENAEFVYKK
jgi:IMP dehydrogenase